MSGWWKSDQAKPDLPDWSMPPGDSNDSTRWAWIKKEFTKRWLTTGAEESEISIARQRERRRGIWQPRFWEHSIRDEDDYEKHFDYIHYDLVCLRVR